MLIVDEIETFYGTSQALFGVSFEVRAGEVVTLLGRNGMGKSTSVRSVMGLTPVRSGSHCIRRKAHPSEAQLRHRSCSGSDWFPKDGRFFPT